MIEAVTFDYWATLVHVGTAADSRQRRLASVGARLREHGHDVSDAELDAALSGVTARQDEHWRANRQYTFEPAVDELFARLAITPADELRMAATDDFTGTASDFVPPLTDHIAATLAELQRRGVRLGIICDVGLTPSTVLRRHLERHEVLGAFDHWSFSDDVGVYKPAPEIFAHALAGLGDVAPEHAAHVGDLKATDVAGARAAGMRTIRYRGDNDDPEPLADADVVIDDHRQLLGALGLA